MKKILLSLFEEFIKKYGRKPNNLEMILLKQKAMNQAIDEKKVIQFPRDKITDWTKARPQPPEVKTIDGIKTTRGMGDLFGRQLEKVKKTEAEIAARLTKQNKETVANINQPIL